MRVLYVVGQLRLGGLERQLAYLLRQSGQGSWQPAVVVWNYSENDFYARHAQELGIPVFGFYPEWSRTKKLLSLRKLVRSLNPDVVHSYSFYTNFAAWFGCLATRAVPLGALRSNFHGEKALAGPILGRLCARWPLYHIANSNAAAHAARAAGFWSPRKVEVIRNGLDLSHFQPLGSWAELPTVTGIGSLLDDKRWDRLLHASVALRDVPHTITLVGNGPARPKLAAQIEKFGLNGQFQLLGERNDIASLLSQSRFLTHTSDREGCPNVVMEAMACGRAVVATDAGDIPELIEQGTTGFLVRRGDDQALVDRMRTLILNPDLCRKMGIAGRAKAEREFGLDHLFSKTRAVYDELRQTRLARSGR